MSEWKPGDVATGTVNGRPNVRVIAGWSKYDPQLRWGELSPRWADGDDDECWFFPSQVTDLRPLVVIDPDDAEEVGWLAAALVLEHATLPDRGVSHRGLRDALREFARPTPPRPEEPTGLGAVVEDEDGVLWTRTEPANADVVPWTPSWTNRSDDKQPDHWENLRAVRVLSEGVQA